MCQSSCSSEATRSSSGPKQVSYINEFIYTEFVPEPSASMDAMRSSDPCRVLTLAGCLMSDALVKYMETFASEMNLKVRFNSRVSKISKEGSRFFLQTPDKLFCSERLFVGTRLVCTFLCARVVSAAGCDCVCSVRYRASEAYCASDKP